MSNRSDFLDLAACTFESTPRQVYDHLIVAYQSGKARFKESERKSCVDTGITATGTSWWVEVGKGLICAAFGYFGAKVIAKYKAHNSRNMLSVSYLENIASALERMVSSREDGRVPETDADTFIQMVRGLDEQLPDLVDDKVVTRLFKLSYEYDAIFRQWSSPKDQASPELDGWIVDARKAICALRGRAHQLK